MNEADDKGSAECRARTSPYRGSQKHKNRPIETRKGTLCPEWTHRVESGGYAGDPFQHDWTMTAAHRMFEASIEWQNGRRRFATANGIAFEAKLSGDETWHGYPIPWESVPAEILRSWREEGKVSKRDLRLYRPAGAGDLHWALTSDVA
ncbi:hypothetical protein [Cupriavidus plantarum]|uniref:hypothetical protein n=1 Tax=Cupriavidus plantarum TaxID=942865 RepID=UPI001BA8265D|nr:hypothetical protein [Cupriavidus plantarum]